MSLSVKNMLGGGGKSEGLFAWTKTSSNDITYSETIIREASPLLETEFDSRYMDGAMYNGKLYMCGNTSTGANMNFRIFDGTSVISAGFLLPYSASYFNIIVHNGEIHVLGGSGTTQHYKLVGDSWVSVSTLPTRIYGGAVVSYNGEIHVIGSIYSSSYYKRHWVYSDSNGWTQLSDPPCFPRYTNAVVYDGKIHCFDSSSTPSTGTNHYAYDGTSWSLVSVAPPFIADCKGLVVYNDELHILGAGTATTNQRLTHYKFVDGEWQFVQGLPWADHPIAFVMDDAIYYYGHNSGYFTKAWKVYGKGASVTGAKIEVNNDGNKYPDFGDVDSTTYSNLRHVINGKAIKVKASSGLIKAPSFVEDATEVQSWCGTGRSLVTTGYSGYYYDCCEISKDKAVVINSRSNANVYAYLCDVSVIPELNNTPITLAGSSTWVRAVSLGNNRCLVFIESNYSTNGVMVKLLEYKDGTLTVVASKDLVCPSSTNYGRLDVMKLSDNKVILAKAGRYAYNFYLVPVEVDGNTISCGESTAFTIEASHTWFALAVESDKSGYIISDNNSIWYVTKFTVDGLSVTLRTTIATSATSQQNGCAYCYNGTVNYLGSVPNTNGIVNSSFTYNDKSNSISSITNGVIYKMATSNNINGRMRCWFVSPSYLLVSYGYGTYAYRIYLGYNLITKTATQNVNSYVVNYASYEGGLATVSDNKMLYICGDTNSNYLYGITIDCCRNRVKKSQSSILGIALSDIGQETEEDVYVLE